MAVNSCLDIAGEIGVERSRAGVFPGQAQRFGKQADARLGGTNHCDGQLIAFDHNFGARAHPFQ